MNTTYTVQRIAGDEWDVIHPDGTVMATHETRTEAQAEADTLTREDTLEVLREEVGDLADACEDLALLTRIKALLEATK